ncbi:Protein sof1 [Tieghemiomyces parasiticus]|uniref:DDB1- and CUL4-associated factor 13 n=1 Tax=Tieghemiomyces parasiticus TaxID=78921 RepID=A0A9W8A6W1_9FUNG|nr:Protein sof1 [Tieghemiomyces parasiticus]
MKVKTISRSHEEFTRQRKTDRQVIQRNRDPVLHPFEKAKEIKRAVNAAKLQKLFSKPFVANMAGHVGGVQCMSKHPWDLRAMISGSEDGEIRVWDMTNHETIWRAEKAHVGVVRGVCTIPHTRRFLSVGNDRLVKIWGPESSNAAEDAAANFDHEDVTTLSFAERARLSNLRTLGAPKLGAEQDEDEDDDDEDEEGDVYKRYSGDDDSDAEEEPAEDRVERMARMASGQTRGLVRDATGISRTAINLGPRKVTPLATYTGTEGFNAVDHHRTKRMFATSSSVISLWDVDRAAPTCTMEWGADTINTVRFNPTEVDVLASCGTDRTVILYDVRTQSALSKITCALKANAIGWNPMRSANFATASEDGSVYMFDMRNMTEPFKKYWGHTSAVTDVDFSPTGASLATASYDRSIRIFHVGQSTSEAMYYTRRMRNVFCVKYTMDAKYVVSGSNDGNLRLWKAVAHEKLGPMVRAQRDALDYQERLKNRYRRVPVVQKVLNSSITPSYIKTARRLEGELKDGLMRRAEKAGANEVAKVKARLTKSVLQVHE